MAGGDVAVGKTGRGNQRAISNHHFVVCFVALFEAAQNSDRIFDTWLADKNLLESALQGRILLDELSIFIQRGRANQPQFAAGQHGLEHVGGCHGSFAAAGTHQSVELVHESDDLALGIVDLFQHSFEALFKFAPVLCSGDNCRQIEGNELFAFERIGDITGDDALREAFHDRRLTDTWFTNENWVVFGAPGQHLRHPANFLIAANHGIKFSLAGNISEVYPVLLQGTLGIFVITRLRHDYPPCFSVVPDGGSARLSGFHTTTWVDRFARWPARNGMTSPSVPAANTRRPERASNSSASVLSRSLTLRLRVSTWVSSSRIRLMPSRLRPSELKREISRNWTTSFIE